MKTGPNSKRAKIEDVAEAANVSIMSVSRAMRGVEGISQSKRQEILKLARDMGYYPNNVAVSLAASSSNLIGVSVPTLFGTVFSEIYEGMRSRFEKAGFATVIDISEYSIEHEEAWVERMISWQPAGIVLSGVDHSEHTRKRLKMARIPVLEIWDLTDDPIDLCIGVDHAHAGQKIGDHLVDLGYSNPAYVGITRGHDIRAERRLAGLEASFDAHDLSFCAYDRAARASTFEAGFQATKRLLKRNDITPDVICYLNDNMAFGGLMYCDQNNISCPQNVGIAGYNGLGINSVLKQRITTAITPRFQMGEEGASLLIARIMGAKTPSVRALSIKMDPGGTTQPQPKV